MFQTAVVLVVGKSLWMWPATNNRGLVLRAAVLRGTRGTQCRPAQLT